MAWTISRRRRHGLGLNPLVGVIYHWIGGLASASNFIPFRPIKRWSFEIYWIIQGFAAWIVAPWIVGYILVPDVLGVLREAPAATLWHTMFWGAMWGVGGLTFGLAVRYLGIALGYAIALGFCTAFGTLMPPIFNGQIHGILHQTGGRVILLGVAICIVAIAVNGLAGYSKEKEVPPEERAAIGERDYSFAKGLAVAIFAGIMSSCFAYGLSAGKGIAQIARQQLIAHGDSELWQNLPVLIVVLIGGFATNLLWSIILILRNRSAAQFLGAPGINPEAASPAEPIAGSRERLTPSVLFNNYALASFAGILWYFQFFFYSMGQTKMGKYDFSSWTLHMASIIIFATLWGLVLHEWRDTSRRTRLLMAFGLLLLIGSTVVVGWGNYLESLT
jgi:L-rhamnose-H+ transport protein